MKRRLDLGGGFELKGTTLYLECKNEMNLTSTEFDYIDHECSNRCRVILNRFYANADSFATTYSEEFGVQKSQVYLGQVKECATETIDSRVNTYIEMCRKLGKFPDGDDIEKFISTSKPFVLNKLKLFSD